MRHEKSQKSSTPLPLIVGLTGGIGSGKTTVANLFARLGVPVIDADLIAKELTLKGQAIYQAIVDKLGLSILNPNQSLNRSLLREKIIADHDLKSWLEKLIHPKVRKQMAKKIASLNTPYCLLVIPLLIENLPHPLVERILVVDTTISKQQQRVKNRDQLDKKTVDRLIAMQTNRNHRLAYANEIIKNNDTTQQLQQAVRNLHHHYLKLAKTMTKAYLKRQRLYS